MANLSGKARAKYVQRMFARVARRYDLTNRWMTWGQNVRWCHEMLDLAHVPVGGKLLDIGTGTGDLVLEARQRDKTLFAVGADFTTEMMQHGRNRLGGDAVLWLNTDAHNLPFRTRSFDAVISGYLLRNVYDAERALAEQYRVLKPGGYIVCLDTTPPPGDFWHVPARVYLRFVIPMIGRLIGGDAKAYEYLSESTEHFIEAEKLADYMRAIGLSEVHFRRFLGGTMAIHWGYK